VTPGAILPTLDDVLRRLAHRPLAWIVLGVLVAAGAAGLYWFQPWKLVTSHTVNDALPSAAPVTGTAAPTSPSATPASTAGNTLLATGELISHEHHTSGTVKLIRLGSDSGRAGAVQLLLENLDTSDGPDLRVWLTDQAVQAGSAGWHVFDDGRYVEVGRLKGNKGNQVYDVPAGTSLDGLDSVTIWCARFKVSFGAAQLRPAR
jgi:Electron transfer DM13